MKLGKKSGLMSKLQDNMLDLAFAVYNFGYQQSQDSNKKATFPEFCRKIKQIHINGNKIREKLARGEEPVGFTNLEGNA